MKQKLILLGAGGYAKSVLDSLDREIYEFCGFVDSVKPIGSKHLGYPILSDSVAHLSNRNIYKYFISIGDNTHRAEKYHDLEAYFCEIISIIDKTALISSDAELGLGVFVGKLAIINSDVKIGNNVIVNTKALLEHGVRVAKDCNISTNATINGDVCVEEGCFIGSSSVINGQLVIGECSVVGAGAVVTHSVASYQIVAGVPAKKIKEIKR